MATTNHILAQLPLPTSDTVFEIPVHGANNAIVDAIDADLIQTHWNIVGTATPGYAQHHVKNGKSFYMHRIILERVLGRSLIPGECVDHVNGNGLDNRRSNLRLATHQQNMHNQRLSRANTSGYKGVHWNRRMNKWQARIKVDGVKHTLGYFDDPVEAYRSYCEGAKRYHKEFANLG